ncbi:MAG: hypothetical protein PHR78_01630 [Eubacteriales bacterium]|nr:hypothetical protein [Eubacteriales bacterium]
MEKISKKKISMTISLVIGIIGFAYIMIFRKPGVLEVLALIFFALVINFSSSFVLTRNDYKYKHSDLIHAIVRIGGAVAIFFAMNR